MKLTLESESLMTLKDYNISHFIGGFVFFGLGAVFAYMLHTEIIPLVFGLLFAVIGLGLLATTKMVSISLDKGIARAQFSLRSLIKNESKEVALGQIKGLILEKAILRSRKGGTRRRFVIVFVLDTSERLEFEFGTIAGGIDVLVSPDDKMRAEAQRVADFLGVPLKFEGPPSIHETLSTMKDAIGEHMDRANKI